MWQNRAPPAGEKTTYSHRTMKDNNNSDSIRRRSPRRFRHLRLKEEEAARFMQETFEEMGGLPATADKQEALCILRRIMREGIVAVRKADVTVPFGYALRESIASRANRRPVTLRDLRYYTNRILRCNPGLEKRPMRDMSVAECRDILHNSFSTSIQSYRKARAILHSIFAYALRREWVDKNPVDYIEPPHVRETPIHPLSLPEIERLEAAARTPEHRDMQLSLHLMLYCGVRPTEVQRIDPARDIDWAHRQVLIRPQTSKTGGGRIVPLRKAASVRRDCRQTIPADWGRRWKRLRRSAQFTNWQADVCRHTFASYHAQRFRNLTQLQMEMGHSGTELLRTRYVMARLGNEAREFWK